MHIKEGQPPVHTLSSLNKIPPHPPPPLRRQRQLDRGQEQMKVAALTQPTQLYLSS